ncbi:MAG: c-type cytochrome [Pseudomonadota bacterium]|nr:c-type cytochrome [Pseudomonadota bacterium]
MNALRAAGCALASVAAGPLVAAAPAEIAKAEYEEVIGLQPNMENGRRAYVTCAVCHRPEGWGSRDGSYPQIAGQLRNVIIKQLADIRARNRDNPLMYPFSVPRILGGPQEIADVAAYVAKLPMTPHNGVGPGGDLELGRQLYEDNCVKCHGRNGEGIEKEHMPAIAGQHFQYLMRQFDMIRVGRRKNADSKMVKQIEGFSSREQAAVLDYTSRLRPDGGKLAKDGWLNPDFPSYVRNPAPEPPPIPAMPEPPAPPPMPEMPPMPEPPEPPPFPR